MSRAAKQSILILIILLLGSVGFAAFTSLEKQKIEKKTASLQEEVDQSMMREKKILAEKKNLEDQLAQIDVTKKQMESDVARLNEQLSSINGQVTTISKERDDWKSRVDTLQAERDQLLAKVKEISEAQVVQAPPPAPAPEPAVTPQPLQPQPPAIAVSPDEENESYWAAVLKQKAELEVELTSLRTEFSSSHVEIDELKKENKELQAQIDRLNANREDVNRQLKRGEDLARTLSVDLARAKNDNKFMSDRIAKMSEENEALHQDMKELTTTKIALEKSIVRLTEEKGELDKKLSETENVIQSRIEEIWGIKDSIDEQFKRKSASKDIELPPIVVSPNGAEAAMAPENNAGDQNAQDSKSGAQTRGNIVSINDENNFVIVDLGERAGMKVGDKLSVYRGPKFIADLEIIQTRNDISAADIRQKASPIKVGDTVR